MKNAKTKIWTIMFAACLALSLLYSGPGGDSPTSVQAAKAEEVLKFMGTIENASDYEKHSVSCFRKKSGGGYLFYSLLGDSLNKEPAAECDTLKHDSGGYYILKREGKEMYEVSLVSSKGEELIPYGPVLIEELGDRYAAVYYVDGKTENEDEAVVFASAGSLIAITPSEEDTLYTGEVKVYDLEKKKFVKGLSFKKPTHNLNTVGDIIVGFRDDTTPFMCDADGKDVSGGKSYIHNGNIFFERTQEGNVVYDEHLNKLFTTNANVYSLKDTPSVIGISGGDSSKYGCCNLKGETIVDQKYDTPLLSLDKYALAYKEGDKYGLIDTSGNIITKPEYKLILATDEPGFYSAEKENSGKQTYDLLTPEGAIYKDYEESFYNVTPAYQDDTTKKYRAFVVADKDFTLENEEGIHTLSRGIAEVKDKNGKSGIYELAEGEQILDYKYKRAFAMLGYLYMETEDDKYEIYEIQY